MFETTTSKRDTAVLRVAFVILLALGTMAFCGCSAQAGSSANQSSLAVEETEDSDNGIRDDREVRMASIVDGQGQGGTTSASEEEIAFAQGVAEQLGVPIRDDISFGMGPLILDKSQADVPLRTMSFYEGPRVCAVAYCEKDGTIYGDSTPYGILTRDLATG